MRIEHLKIRYKNMRNVGWLLMLISIYKVGYSSQSKPLDMLYDIARYITILISITILFKQYKTFFKEKTFIFLVIIKLYVVVMNLINGVDNIDSLYSFILVSLQCVLYSHMIRKDKESAFKVFRLTFEIIVYINFISTLLHPEGLYNFESDRIFTFIGHANTTLYFTLPLVVISLIIINRPPKCKRIDKNRALLDIGICLFSTIIIKSSTSFVVYAVFCAVLIYEWKNRKKIRIKMFSVYVVIIAISAGFIFLGMQRFLTYFFEVILKRSLDFTGRTYYWAIAVKSIIEKPIFGHGNIPGGVRLGGMSYHSYLLETLYEGGFVLLSMFTVLFYHISVVLDRYRNNIEARIIFSGLSSIMLTFIVESNISYDVFYILIIWAICIPQICKKSV